MLWDRRGFFKAVLGFIVSGGLLGLAVHPERDDVVYLYATFDVGGVLVNGGL